MQLKPSRLITFPENSKIFNIFNQVLSTFLSHKRSILLIKWSESSFDIPDLKMFSETPFMAYFVQLF